MSARRMILRELHQRHQDAGTYIRPATIRGFDRDPARYQSAVNGLLSERLINGAKDEEGRLAVQLNPERMGAVRRELRPWFVRHLAPLAALAGFALALFWLITAA